MKNMEKITQEKLPLELEYTHVPIYSIIILKMIVGV